MNNTKEQLQRACEDIAKEIGEAVKVTQDMINDYYPDAELGEQLSAHDYLGDMLDINYLVDSELGFLSAKITMSLGGPNIYINTRDKEIVGYWGGGTTTVMYNDVVGIGDFAEELYNSLKQN